MRIEQSVKVGHLDGGFDGRDSQRHAIVERRFRTDFHQAQNGEKPECSTCTRYMPKGSARSK